jgi:hypothetical protein
MKAQGQLESEKLPLHANKDTQLVGAKICVDGDISVSPLSLDYLGDSPPSEHQK